MQLARLRRSLRRTLVALPIAALSATALAGAPAQAVEETGALSIRGADLSFLPQLEAIGVKYRDVDEKVAPAEDIFADHGANYMRIRVWINPPAGYTNEATALALARRAKKAGMKILLDPHYSDFWADPQKQPIPTGWPTDLTALSDTVRAYTRDLVQKFANQKTPVDIFQMGNEITNGILWPTGQLYVPGRPPQWDNLTTLLKAGIRGAKEGNIRHPEMRVMVHIDKGGLMGDTRYFFDNVVSRGVPFDIIGQSYYPMWHGSFAQLQANLNDSVARYNKDVLLSEVAYPWTFEDGDRRGNFVWEQTPIPDVALYPVTPLGQHGFYEALRRTLLAVPSNRGLGFFAWEPEWLPGLGWEPGGHNPNDNLTQFDFTGKALPSIYAYRPPSEQ